MVRREKGEVVFYRKLKKITAQPILLFLTVVWLDSNTQHKGWSCQTALVGLDESAAKDKWVPRICLPIWEANVRVIKITANGEKAQGETTFPPGALRLHFSVLLSMFPDVRQHSLQHTKSQPPN